MGTGVKIVIFGSVSAVVIGAIAYLVVKNNKEKKESQAVKFQAEESIKDQSELNNNICTFNKMKSGACSDLKDKTYIKIATKMYPSSSDVKGRYDIIFAGTKARNIVHLASWSARKDKDMIAKAKEEVSAGNWNELVNAEISVVLWTQKKKYEITKKQYDVAMWRLKEIDKSM